jgi:quercetin dioxygenase-like cupin family protein
MVHFQSEAMFLAALRATMIVEKLWGYERVLHNDERYCMKELVLKRGYQSSLHTHTVKAETFYVVAGCVQLEIEGVGVLRLNPGDHASLEPGQYHRFMALTEVAKVIEASMRHDDADVHRKEDSRKLSDAPDAVEFS